MSHADAERESPKIDQQVGSVDSGAVVGAAAGDQVNVGGEHHHAAPGNEQKLVQQFILSDRDRERERQDSSMPTDDRTNERLDRIFHELGSLRGEFGAVRGEVTGIKSEVNQLQHQVSQVQHQLTTREAPALNWTIIAIAMVLAALVSVGTYYLGAH